MGFKSLLVASLAVGVIAAMAPFVFPDGIVVGFWLGIFWVASLIVALFKYGKRGLWLLVGAPFALFVPYIAFGILWGCTFHQNCP